MYSNVDLLFMVTRPNFIDTMVDMAHCMKHC